MTGKDSLNIVVEDVLSGAVMQRILASAGYVGNATYRITRGNGKIKTSIDKFKAASRIIPHIVLTDLDRFPCPPALLNAWNIVELPPSMLLRIAVHEVESWLLADRQGIASFLGTAAEKIPFFPERLIDPKQALFSVVRKSRKRRLIEEIVPLPGAHIGPLYNEHLGDFVLRHWDLEAAIENAPSLARNISRISNFLQR